MKRAIMVLFFSTVAMAGSVPSAHAAAIHHESTVSIDYGAGDFFGTVESEARRCSRARTVELLMAPADGNTGKAAQSVIESDETGDDGSWLVGPVSVEAADYQAKAKRKAFTRNGRRHVCDRALSEVLKFR